MTPIPPPAWTWTKHPDGTNMTIREMTPEDREIAHRRAMWRSITARYENTLRYLEDNKRAAALTELEPKQ